MSESPLHTGNFCEGDSFSLRKDPVTTRQLVMYAGASGDYNPIHYDLPHAQQAGLGGVIAHGMLTMGFAAQCVTDWAGPATTIVEVGGRFLSPVRPGDVVEMTGRVDAVAADGLCNLTLVGHVGDRQVFAGQATVQAAD
ncbi:MaoC/PaaZ C-terminal domain-containing protein [Pseudohoeflea coraliihabitans]|uniref:MaoC family dehydratase N-terminal domain-containing protein n=1 Tax=Pseudohoeflea coraliihabitans TaxID=2860393 RepID=A0ABS6WIW1_9HYPH|nr:MaoC/PaaZ C-terminal domain-containing protein [Pseudohoeflea sp. DP4N28-3]MBW3095800.1 MaoC family dehydratase N-terminal domain-containing protein [Pseudohoeflea sp. DP4N28-3]